MNRRLSVVLGALALMIAAAGCFELEQTIELNEHLSGTISVQGTMDMKPFVPLLASVSRSREGLTGPPTKADLAKARAELVEQYLPSPDPEQMERENQAIEDALPAGVGLLESSLKIDDLKSAGRLRYSFDHVSLISGIRSLSSDENPTPDKNPFDVEVIDHGKTITIRTRPENLLTEKKVSEEAEMSLYDSLVPDMKLKPEIEELLNDAYKGLRVTYRITAPLRLVSHNATRVDGKTLVWTYDKAALEKMEAEGAELSMEVTYRKPLP